jgi:hypothetical protein
LFSGSTLRTEATFALKLIGFKPILYVMGILLRGGKKMRKIVLVIPGEAAFLIGTGSA